MMSIRQARRMRDISQNQMAADMGIHVQTYRKIENHPEEATIEQAKCIARLLGMSYDELNFFEDDSTLSSNTRKKMSTSRRKFKPAAQGA